MLFLWLFLNLSPSASGQGILIKDCNFPATNKSFSMASSVGEIWACKQEFLAPERALSVYKQFYTEKGHRRVKRIVGGRPATPPLSTRENANEAIVFIDDSDKDRSARVSGSAEQHYHAFRGIRFAEPPVESYRFQRPKRRVMRGEVNATAFGPPCTQYNSRKREIIGAEDCLSLNVFTPKVLGDELYPVIFWIHGGGFISGSSAQYDPVNLVKQKLIVVTIQYRLGSLGFLGDSTKDLPGNAGLFDVLAALHWTRTYIQHFGGDPNRIVVGGQGSGASIASFLELSEFTQSQISGIIAMSGTPISSFAVDEQPAAYKNNITRLSSCDKESSNLAVVKCMQRVAVKDIIMNDNLNLEGHLSSDGVITLLSKSLNPSAVVEGENDDWFLPFFLNKQPLDSLQGGSYAEIPMLTGVTLHETSTAVKGGYKDKIIKILKEIPQYLDQVLPKSLLLTNTGLLEDGKVNGLLNALFGNLEYLKLLNVGAAEELDRVVQMSTDALFNLPLFLMSNLRSERANTFVYSFEHASESGKAASKEFLPNAPITKDDQNTASGTEVGNGEDLVQLFDVRSMEGNEIPAAKIDGREDLIVRELFSAAVAEFAYYGKPALKNSKFDWPPFSKENSEYAVIKINPEIRKDFRYCEMGLWSGILIRLQSSKCNFPNINNILSSVPADLWNNSLTNTLFDVGGGLNPNLNIPGVGGILKPNSGVSGSLTGNQNPIGGLLGLGGNDQNKQTTTTQKAPTLTTQRPTTTKPPSAGGLLGLDLGGLFG